jgi:putative ABC transport system substrate-binding protein
MTRYRLAQAATLILLLCASAAGAIEVAVLKSGDVPAWRPTLDALKRQTSAHTLTEYDLRGDTTEAARVVASLKGRTSLLVALGPLAVQAAKEGAPEIPLIYLMVQDPTRAGLIGAPNTTGVAFQVPVKNQLAAFRMVNPRGVRVGVIYNPESTGRQVAEAQKAASVVRLQVVERPVASDREVPEALRGLLKGSEAVDALWIPPDSVLLADESRRFVLAETLKAGKPVYTSFAALVPEGALVCNGPDLVSIGELAGELVGRIAAGEKAGKIDPMIPRAELIINKKIAERLRIDIPADALKAASKVY